jgi:hypothetical protein
VWTRFRVVRRMATFEVTVPVGRYIQGSRQPP